MTSRAQLVHDLQTQIRALEHPHPLRSGGVVSTGLEELDRLLPGNGLMAGSLVEWVASGDGAGAMSLALTLAARVQAAGGPAAVVDPAGEFYPPAAQGLGLALQTLLVVRPTKPREVRWGWEQLLRSSAVAVTMGWIDTLAERSFRRLQAAAETGESLGFLLRPRECLGQPTWAEARLLVEAKPSGRWGRQLRVHWLAGRGKFNPHTLDLELDDETGALRLVSPVADPAPLPQRSRSARA